MLKKQIKNIFRLHKRYAQLILILTNSTIIKLINIININIFIYLIYIFLLMSLNDLIDYLKEKIIYT